MSETRRADLLASGKRLSSARLSGPRLSNCRPTAYRTRGKSAGEDFRSFRVSSFANSVRFAFPLPNLLLLTLLLAACAAPAPAAPQPALTVFAAASLTDSFKEIGSAFTADTGIPLTFNFAGSQQLRAQLEQGADADVFASANKREMSAAIASGLVISGTDKTFARNRLIVIYPKAGQGRVTGLADLAKPGLKLVLADKTVPVGQYGLDMLDKMSADPAFGPDFKAKVLANVVSYEQTVKAVVSKVQLGEADAGVVYATDVTPGVSARVIALAVPAAFNQVATYPIAPLTRSKQAGGAGQFVAYVLSEKGQAILAQYGFAGGTNK